MKYHYTYRLIDTANHKLYIGARTSNVPPAEDTLYMSSSKVIKQLIANGRTFDKVILRTFNSREDAIAHEILYHNHFDVAKNPDFYNLSKQTSTGFDHSGVKATAERLKQMTQLRSGFTKEILIDYILRGFTAQSIAVYKELNNKTVYRAISRLWDTQAAQKLIHQVYNQTSENMLLLRGLGYSQKRIVEIYGSTHPSVRRRQLKATDA